MCEALQCLEAPVAYQLPKKKKKEEEEEEEEENPMNALFPFAWLNLFSSSFLLAFSFHILTLPRALANKQTNKQTKKKNAYNTAHPRQPHFVLRQETSIFSLHETTNSERLRNERGKKKQEKGRPLLRSCSSFSFCFKHLPIASSFLPFFFFFFTALYKQLVHVASPPPLNEKHV